MIIYCKSKRRNLFAVVIDPGSIKSAAAPMAYTRISRFSVGPSAHMNLAQTFSPYSPRYIYILFQK
jgi:predicted secreted Zn-dependent protease